MLKNQELLALLVAHFAVLALFGEVAKPGRRRGARESSDDVALSQCSRSSFSLLPFTAFKHLHRKSQHQETLYNTFCTLPHPLQYPTYPLMSSPAVYIAAGRRTAFGAFGGKLKSYTAAQVR